MKKLFLGILVLFFTINCFSLDLYVKNRLKGIHSKPEIEIACYNAVQKFINTESSEKINIIEDSPDEYDFPRIDFFISTSTDGKNTEIKVELYKSETEIIKSEIDYLNNEMILSSIDCSDMESSKTITLPYKWRSEDDLYIYEFSDEDDNNNLNNNYVVEMEDFHDLLKMINSSNSENKKVANENETTIELNKEQLYFSKNFENLLYLYLKAFLSFLDDTQISQQKINFIDNMPLGYYYNLNKDFSSEYVFNLSTTKDGKIIVANSLGLCVFSSYGELISILSEQIPKEYIKNEKYNSWRTHITDDDVLMVINLNSPYVFLFDKEMNYIGKKSYNFPSYNLINEVYFDGNDEPVVYKYDTTGIKVGQGVDENINYKIGLNRTFNSLFITKNNKTWFLYDNTIFVYDENNFLNKIIICENLSSVIPGSEIIYVHDNNDFICSNYQGEYYKYNSNGKMISSFNVEKKMLNYCSYNNGIYYIPTYEGVKRFCEDGIEIDKLTKELITLNNDLNKQKKLSDLKKYLDLAKEFAKEKAYWTSYNLISEYLKYCPGDSYASELKLKYELELAKEVAYNYKNSAIELYDTYGEETAKADYSIAMQLIEKFKKYFPDDKELNEMYFDLNYTFSDGDYNKKTSVSSLSVESVYLNSVFPALKNYYSKNPSGKIIVKNNSKNIINNLTISSNIKKYMDYASESEIVKELKPGETKEINLYTLFNDKILSVIENQNSQVLINLLWEENGTKEKLSVSRSIVVYNKSAITWQDTGMLSCFILPEDINIKTLAYEILNSNDNFILSKNFTNAISLINGIKSLNLKYVPDPVSIISNLIDNDYAIDSIKYPSETIKLKGGDCDDLTVLFSSLLESAGIETALITTEGHIFGAFNTGMTYNIIFENLDKKLLVLNVDGYAWIPIETTIINNGFFESWKKASEELENMDDTYNLKEIVLLSEVRDIYPPVSFASGKYDTNYSENLVSKFVKEDCDNLNLLVKKALDTLIISNDVYELNSLARIFYIYGNNDKAIELLKKAIKLEPNYKSAYLNLINIYNKTGNKSESLKLKSKAEKIKDDSSETIKLRAADSSTDNEWDEKLKKGIPVRKSTSKTGSKRTSKGIRTISSRAEDVNQDDWQD